MFLRWFGLLANAIVKLTEFGNFRIIFAYFSNKPIFELANYLKLQKSSQVFGEDSADKTFTMIIAYQDGSAKTWYDYEQGASLSISRLYDLMVKAKESATWEFKEEEAK